MKVLSRVADASEPFARAKMAAALVYKNEIISIGTNKNKTHPLQGRYAKHEAAIYLHSEIDAIANAMRRYDVETVAKSKLFIYRSKWTHSKKPVLTQGMAKPCQGCMRAIAAFDIKHVCYSLEEEGYEWL
jgi:deoxycytidylate deaminase